jgi:hypothetical protein
MATSPMSPMSNPETVRVFVKIRDGRVFVAPEKIRVYVGQPILWIVDTFESYESLRLTIYFDDGSPLEWSAIRLELQLNELDRPEASRWPEQHPFVTGTPLNPGDFKYGVRIATQDDRILDDDDPYISVISRL